MVDVAIMMPSSHEGAGSMGHGGHSEPIPKRKGRRPTTELAREFECDAPGT